MDGVLWDEDWKDADIHLDADPQTSCQLKALFQIQEDYYIDVPADPSEDEQEGICETLRELTRESGEETVDGSGAP